MIVLDSIEGELAAVLHLQPGLEAEGGGEGAGGSSSKRQWKFVMVRLILRWCGFAGPTLTTYAFVTSICHFFLIV